VDLRSFFEMGILTTPPRKFVPGAFGASPRTPRGPGAPATPPRGRSPCTPRGAAPLNPAALHGGPCKAFESLLSTPPRMFVPRFRGFAPDPTRGRCPWTPRGAAPLDPAALHGGPCKAFVQSTSYRPPSSKIQYIPQNPIHSAVLAPAIPELPPAPNSAKDLSRVLARQVAGRGARPSRGPGAAPRGGVAGAAGPRGVRGEAPNALGTNFRGGALRLLLLVLLAVAGASGCASRGWLVKPHQRGYLADRIMRLDSDPRQNAADQHVLVYREGAFGGYGTAGGGCGCN